MPDTSADSIVASAFDAVRASSTTCSPAVLFLRVLRSPQDETPGRTCIRPEIDLCQPAVTASGAIRRRRLRSQCAAFSPRIHHADPARSPAPRPGPPAADHAGRRTPGAPVHRMERSGPPGDQPGAGGPRPGPRRRALRHAGPAGDDRRRVRVPPVRRRRRRRAGAPPGRRHRRVLLGGPRLDDPDDHGTGRRPRHRPHHRRDLRSSVLRSPAHPPTRRARSSRAGGHRPARCHPYARRRSRSRRAAGPRGDRAPAHHGPHRHRAGPGAGNGRIRPVGRRHVGHRPAGALTDRRRRHGGPAGPGHRLGDGAGRAAAGAHVRHRRGCPSRRPSRSPARRHAERRRRDRCRRLPGAPFGAVRPRAPRRRRAVHDARRWNGRCERGGRTGHHLLGLRRGGGRRRARPAAPGVASTVRRDVHPRAHDRARR